jgi:hypothetical protein
MDVLTFFFLACYLSIVSATAAFVDGMFDGHSSSPHDLRTAAESTSFVHLRDNVISVLDKLPATVVGDHDRASLVNAFMNIFRDYDVKKLEELQPAE